MTTVAAGILMKTRRRGPSSFVLEHVIAVTEVPFVALVAVHLFDNLEAYAGVDAFNHYTTQLHEVDCPPLLRQSTL